MTLRRACDKRSRALTDLTAVKIEGRHTYPVDRARVWLALLDPAILARTLPGCEGLEADGPNRFKGRLNIKVGPVQGKFAGTVTLDDIVADRGYRISIQGDGPAGFMKGAGTVRLEDDGAGTALLYDIDANVGGRIASVGQRLLDTTARAITRQALEGLGRQIEALPSAAAGNSAAVAPVAPAPPPPPPTTADLPPASRVKSPQISCRRSAADRWSLPPRSLSRPLRWSCGISPNEETTVMTERIRVEVNGTTYEREVEPRRLLVHFLREDLGLTGTNVGCDTSSCGTCTIHMNGDAVKSCTILAVQADGTTLTTIEGLRTNGQLHPLQKAFWEEHGLQCGYCTPGMIMSALHLLNHNPHPTEEQIRHGLKGNLCRCTGYHNIVKAVQHAAAQGAR